MTSRLAQVGFGFSAEQFAIATTGDQRRFICHRPRLFFNISWGIDNLRASCPSTLRPRDQGRVVLRISTSWQKETAHDLPNHQRLSQQYGPQMTVKHVRSKLDLQSRCISMAQRRMFSIPTYRTGKRPSLRIIHVLFMGVKV